MLEEIAGGPKLKYITTAIFKDNRPSQRFVGNLSAMADWVFSQVLMPLAVVDQNLVQQQQPTFNYTYMNSGKRAAIQESILDSENTMLSSIRSNYRGSRS